MKHIGLFVVGVLILCGVTGVSAAQTPPIKNTETVDTRYVVTDDSVFVYYRKDQSAPFKIYDFSTQHVYVYMSDKYGDNFVAHKFSEIDAAEILYVKKRSCASSGLSGAFQRFCK